MTKNQKQTLTDLNEHKRLVQEAYDQGIIDDEEYKNCLKTIDDEMKLLEAEISSDESTNALDDADLVGTPVDLEQAVE